MKLTVKFRILSVLSLGSVLLAGRDSEQRLKPGEVPRVVIAAASTRFPNARISGWSKEVENGKTTYEASIQDGAAKRDVTLTPDGSLVAIEEAIPVSALPASVPAAVRAKYPKAVISKAEKITHDADIQYEVTLRNAAKKELTFDSQGRVFKEE